MAQKDLIPLNKRTKEEQKRIASMGGKASGEARRERKALKEIMCLLLEKDVTDTKQYNKVAAMGFDFDEIDNATLLVVALFKRACLGDVSAIKEVRSLIGEDNSADVIRKLDEVLAAFDKDANE